MFLFEQPLALILLVLLVGFILSLCISATAHSALRIVTLVTSLCALFLGILSCLAFNKSDFGFQFVTRLHLIPEYNLALTLGADGLSMIFLLLTLFIFPVLFLSAWNVTKQPKQFLNYLLAIELLLVLTFSVLDIFYFYVFFESLLIPMFALIGVWGARERKIKAAYYFFLYTLFGSLFMLFGMIYLYFITGSTNFFVLLNTQLDSEQQQLIWLCFFVAFAVKMPLFPLHIWLPEAHVEAPTVGSMLLASLLLKLGGYGFLRFSLTFLAEGSHQYAPLVCTCSLLGVLYGSLSTLRQIDLKRIIAYSSVAHMNLVMLGLFSFNQQGLEGAAYLMVGHGVVSAALFFCVGVLYDRYHSRLLRYYGGLVAVMPLFAVFFLAFTLANMGFPGTSNFLGEVLVFLGIFALSSTVMLFASPGIVLSAAYSTWLYNRVSFGTLKTTYIKEFTDLTRREAAIFVTLLFFMLVLGVSANFVLDFVHVALKGIVINAETTTLTVMNSLEVSPLVAALAYAPLPHFVKHFAIMFIRGLVRSTTYLSSSLLYPNFPRPLICRILLSLDEFTRCTYTIELCSFAGALTAPRYTSTNHSKSGSATVSAVAGRNTGSSVELAVSPFTFYKHLLTPRIKNSLVYGSYLKGVIGWFCNLRRFRPAEPFCWWENQGQVVKIGPTHVWITGVALAEVGATVYFVPFDNKGLIVCGTVVRRAPHLLLVSVPSARSVDKNDFVYMNLPRGYSAEHRAT